MTSVDDDNCCYECLLALKIKVTLNKWYSLGQSMTMTSALFDWKEEA